MIVTKHHGPLHPPKLLAQVEDEDPGPDERGWKDFCGEKSLFVDGKG